MLFLQLTFFTDCRIHFSLIKDEIQRPKYNKLLEHPFLRQSDVSNVDVAVYVNGVIDKMANNIRPSFDDPSY
jgi:hypothetical protein